MISILNLRTVPIDHKSTLKAEFLPSSIVHLCYNSPVVMEHGDGELLQPQPIKETGSPANTPEAPRLTDNLESKYWEMRPNIKRLYQKVGLWHGTGMFEDNGATDVLKGICDAREIRPHQDSWDPKMKTTKTISATKIRPYAVFYSDMHLQPNSDELLYKDPRKVNVATQISFRNALSVLRHALYIRQLISKEGPRWIERKTGRPVEDREGKELMKQFFRGNLRSTTPGDYPILIGLERNAFEPIKIAGYLSVSEVRTDKPIPIDKITHIEVPLKYMEQTEGLLHERGVPIPVFPREFGERYGSEFSIKELLTGSCFQEDKL